MSTNTGFRIEMTGLWFAELCKDSATDPCPMSVIPEFGVRRSIAESYGKYPESSQCIARHKKAE
jgi:hypothetical protein